MADKQPTQQSDGLGYVPQDIRNLLSNYQSNPDSYSDRQAIFTQLYQNGGESRKLAQALATNGKSEGYQGLASQLKLAYTPTDEESTLKRAMTDKKSKGASVPNLRAVQNDNTSQQQQTQQPNSAWNAAGIYGNLPQHSALSFLMK